MKRKNIFCDEESIFDIEIEEGEIVSENDSSENDSSENDSSENESSENESSENESSENDSENESYSYIFEIEEYGPIKSKFICTFADEE